MLQLPLEIQISDKKKFILNLNNYRNAHYFTLNKAKRLYELAIAPQITKLECFESVRLIYTLYPKTSRRIDTNNVCSIVDKFTCDCLVKMGKLQDDNYKHVVESTFRFGDVDKDNPRCELVIDNLK